MPKIIDNYVLERKIGGGQFGQVFKGYNKKTYQDIAVKVILRSTIKGKFNELLDNEIKILKTCNNENIIKLYDMKKTKNNFYLILEYCNEGDLADYVKKKKTLTEDEAIEFFIQILNAFKTLTKANIMHRDFKLANILKHNGTIKIADFGFSRLLESEDEFASTQLGSPLNMVILYSFILYCLLRKAPEVLDGKKYNSKADIWSIGTVFYEMLFGKSPYNARDIIELRKNISKKQLEFPRKINKISPVVEDVLRKMLTENPQQRIEWADLFAHKVNSILEEEIEKNLHETMNQKELALGMSKFYIKNNMVIQHPAEIQQKQAINSYTLKMAQKEMAQIGQIEEFKGEVVQRKIHREQESQEQQQQQQQQQSQQQSEMKTEQSNEQQQQIELNDLTTQETEREKIIKICKRNSNRILHERNIYVFLASVAEDAMNNYSDMLISQFVGFLLVKQLLVLIDNLKSHLVWKNNIFELNYWEEYIKTKDFNEIFQYISKEFEIFNVYFTQLSEKLNQNIKQKIFINEPLISGELYSAINTNIKQNITNIYQTTLTDYSKMLINQLMKAKTNQQETFQGWVHVFRVIDCLKLDKVFIFEDQGIQFNFKQYYEEPNKYELFEIIQKVQEKLALFKIIF